MAWRPLRTDYTDASWVGDKKYELRNNGDGTYSIIDLTEYSNKAKSFFGAADANAMNGGINLIMETFETDLVPITDDELDAICV